ncbi:nuclease-related domain-containing protein [Neobacillus sp.]|uniref:nuclease-related domain-containing protein n=1 Tax=Neobacillus sp. TaxID=2675273 RepID=UPI00289BB077|nr:nuclease-related domain-containing protein [Neobacillus sp.]
MFKKHRTESLKLKLFRFLNTRMELSSKDKQYYLNLEKGFEGEAMFDLLTKKLQTDCLILNDLLLEVNNSKFQIDTLIISQKTISLFDVKNYDDDFYYELGNFYSKSKSEIKNPLDQLKRCESLLRQMLQYHDFKLPIEPWVVFINPEFTLYQAPQNMPIIFPTQINRFLKKLDRMPSTLTGRHIKLADKLVAMHQIESPYPQLPPYAYDQLQKGITCSMCHSFSISVGEKNIVCDECGREEKVESAVLRSVEELKLLFPDWKITTKVVQEWCKVIESKKTIRKILKRNFRAMGYGQWSCYE